MCHNLCEMVVFPGRERRSAVTCAVQLLPPTPTQSPHVSQRVVLINMQIYLALAST